jgi:phosphatidylglycerophosphate synthase
MLDTILGANPRVRRLQSDVARAFSSVGISANAATIGAIASGVGAAIALGRESLGWGLMMLALSAALDAIDGTIARQTASPTRLGGVLDLTGDRVVEAAVIIAIAWNDPALYFPALALVASWYVNITIFLAVGAALDGGGAKLIEYPPGILERTEAMIFFAVLATVESVAFLRPAGPVICYAMTALEVTTGAQRLAFGIRNLHTGRNP